MRLSMRGVLAAGMILAGCAPSAGVPPTAGPSISPESPPSPSPSAAPSAPVAFALTGEILDDDMSPVEADIVASSDGLPVASARSGSDGKYRLSVPAGAYRLTASKAGWTSRTQAVTINQDTTVNFGGMTDAGANPYFLSNTPEITRVEAQEAAPAGPLELKFHFSEALPEASRSRFVNRIVVMSEGVKPLLYGSGAADSMFKTEAAWDTEGKVFTLTYREPYLASGAANAVYSARIEQTQTTDIDPNTREKLWDPLGIKDAEGNELGRNRADFAFLQPQLTTIGLAQMANEDFGKTHPARRWALTHQSTFTWAAKLDDVAPGVTFAGAKVARNLGTSNDDVLELRMTEPMRVVRSQSEVAYTRLDRDKQLAYVNVSKSADGSNPKPLGIPIADVTFNRNEPNVVYLHYARESFKDYKWVEVILGPDMKDPVGNGPDAAKSRITGNVN